jgi:outer membrane lipoprotein SlyB
MNGAAPEDRFGDRRSSGSRRMSALSNRGYPHQTTVERTSKMKKTIAAVLLILPLAACTQTQQGAAIGGLGGAAIGGAVGGTDGALIGGGAGLIAGALVGRAQENRNECIYSDGRGGTYRGAC